MSSLGASLDVIRTNTIRYGFPILLSLGNFGNLFCIVIFSQKQYRSNSCSLYLLSAAVFSFVGVNWGLGPQINAIYRPPDPFNISLTLCRIRGYILQSSMVLYRTMIVLSCADRFALCSMRPAIRAFSRPKVALKMIGSTTLFWLLASIHLLIFEDIQNGVCSVFGLYGLIFSIYQIAFLGLIAPILMIVFAYFVLKNLKQSRIRIHPIQDTILPIRRILRQRDRDLMRLCLRAKCSSVLYSRFSIQLTPYMAY